MTSFEMSPEACNNATYFEYVSIVHFTSKFLKSLQDKTQRHHPAIDLTIKHILRANDGMSKCFKYDSLN